IKMLDKQSEIKIVDFLRKKIKNLFGLYLFGSYATEMHTSSSDLDIAFLTSEKISAAERWKIQEELASLIDIDIDLDLVDLKEASVILRTEVVENGKLIYTGSAYECDSFEMVTYSMYAVLNESRMYILQDIKKIWTKF
ncbi:type VII toxin-antitoxin system MntA family adenylyltransferase antitoxin, partial [Mariniphaga sp.]|uniref:type VII toxin-antitoxin system MntA family adenylyltransferase antitoxin n=1 Tax=Mariniphaga sp. TaxID=1954475 RepID=UPI00356A40F6